ncbi:MAG: 50S ribosomal protein L25 [Candidatus Velthaea sp.]|jgi:large subunit ribosomal protein L25
MAKAQTSTDSLTIAVRTHPGTTSARAVRRAGQIPAVLYGHGEPTAISIGAKALEELLTHGGKSRILDAVIDGKHDSVLLREVQRDPVSHRPIHVDFQRVTQGEEISATVAIAVTGNSAAVRDGAILDIVTRSIDVKGAAGKIPESITVDTSELTIHSHITAGELPLPEGFTLLTPADQVIVSVEAPRTGAAEETAVAAEPAAEAPAAEAPAAS